MTTLKDSIDTNQTRTKLNKHLSDWNDAEIEISVRIRGNDGEEMGFEMYTMSELKAFVDAVDEVNPWEDVDGVETLMGLDDLSTLLQRKSGVKMHSE